MSGGGAPVQLAIPANPLSPTTRGSRRAPYCAAVTRPFPPAPGLDWYLLPDRNPITGPGPLSAGGPGPAPLPQGLFWPRVGVLGTPLGSGPGPPHGEIASTPGCQDLSPWVIQVDQVHFGVC